MKENKSNAPLDKLVEAISNDSLVPEQEQKERTTRPVISPNPPTPIEIKAAEDLQALFNKGDKDSLIIYFGLDLDNKQLLGDTYLNTRDISQLAKYMVLAGRQDPEMMKLVVCIAAHLEKEKQAAAMQHKMQQKDGRHFTRRKR